MTTKRTLLQAALCACATFAAPQTYAQADGFPSKTLRFIVPFAAGGPADVVAREVAQALGKELGQSVVVENLGGGAGVPATNAVVRAPADGYTLLFAASGNVVIQPLLSKKRVDILTQLSPVSMVTTSPHVLVVSSQLPVRTVKELIDHAKANPGSLNFASAGVGGLAHLASEWFMQQAGIQGRHLAYKGSSQAMTDLASGQVQAMFSSLPSMKGMVDKGLLRVVGVSSRSQSPTYKDFPLIKQAGLPGFEYTTWYGLFGPVGVPPAVVEKLGTALGKLAADKAFEARLREQGVDLHVSAPQELAERTRKETAEWDKVIRESGIHLN